jgi:hypothetical protein
LPRRPSRRLEDPSTWDPAAQTLVQHLAASVVRLSWNQWRRKRNRCEVALDEHAREAEQVGTDEEQAPDVLHRRRVAHLFHERLDASFQDDQQVQIVMTLMAEGITKPREQKSASDLEIEDVREARRRLFYRAKQVTEELSEELGEDIEEVAP